MIVANRNSFNDMTECFPDINNVIILYFIVNVSSS